MKAKMLEYNIMKSQKISVLRDLVYLRMMLIQLSGLNVPMNCRVWAHAECLEMCDNAYVCIACETLLV